MLRSSLLLVRPMVTRSVLLAGNARINEALVHVRTFGSKKKKRKNSQQQGGKSIPRPDANARHVLTSATGLTRAENVEKLRETSRQMFLHFEDVCRGRKDGRQEIPDPPPDAAHHLLSLIDNKIPEEVMPRKDALQDYILNTFLVKYPTGARLRKLQRDIAFRMDTKTAAGTQKPEYEMLMPIIGEMERANQIKLRLGRIGRLIIYKPSATQLAVEVLNNKIGQVMDAHFKTEDDVDGGSETEEEPLELSDKEWRRINGSEDDETDWVEEFRNRDKEELFRD